MPYNSLAEFVQVLERAGELRRVAHPVKADLEITEIADRVMKSAGPALLFENVAGKSMPVLINAFGSLKRMALALGVNDGDRRRYRQADPDQAAKVVQRQVSFAGRAGEAGRHSAEDC